MATVLPRHVVCILGNWRAFDKVEAIIRQVADVGFELDREYSQLSPDGRMTASFEASYDRVTPSMTDEDWRAVRKHGAVAYVLSPPIRKEQAADISGLTLLLTAALLREGGVAAKGEGAGIAHGRSQWLELANDFLRAREQADTHTQGATLFWAWVRRPLFDEVEAVYYSCGMHLLGLRDIEIESSLGLDAGLQWLDLLGLYLAADRPTRPIKNGEGFCLKPESPRRVLRLASCKRYARDEFLFNPFGYIRLEPDHEASAPATSSPLA